MTLEDLKAMDKELLSPTDVISVIGGDPYYISLQAREDPKALGFPVMRIGKRTRTPRRAFIRWLEGGGSV